MNLFVTGFADLAKPQWVAALRELKLAGGLPVSELCRRLAMSYMAVKQYCEDLHRLGYLDRSRAPRTEVGRPEIFYRLSRKADALFPEAGVSFSLELLETSRNLFGESAPERLMFLHFQQLLERWQPLLQRADTPAGRAALLAGLMEREGRVVRCEPDAANGLRIVEYHHPLRRIFERYPRAVGMELRMIETLLGTRIVRREVPGGPSGPARIDFEISAPAEGEASPNISE